MPLVSSSIANLVNGVSQQPYTLRLSSQSEIQENGLSTVAQGLKKRPPSQHLKRISAPPVGGAHVHTINRDTTEQYAVVLTSGDLKVYDTSGNEKTVNFPSGKAYLTAAAPLTDFRAVTVADYTFVLNRSVAVTASGTTKPLRPFDAIIVVKTGLYSKNFSFNINGVSRSYTTPDGSAVGHALLIATDYISNQITTLVNSVTGTTGVTAVQFGSVIYLSKSIDFTVTTSDGYSDAAMYVVKRRFQRFSDLPNNAGVNNFTVEIVGDKATDFDNYWVNFDTSGGSGVWRETLAPGTALGFSAATMPWALVRETDGTFTFKPLTWANRTVGDITSAPDPSFVGRNIQDIFFYRNRLGFIADESVCFSEAGEFFNFYPTTVTDLIDSDRIDVSVSHTKVSNLVAAVPFAKQLLLFSAQTQFVVESGDLLTPSTISIKPATEFECDPEVHPESVGKVVYFSVPRGTYSGVREYFVDTVTGNNDAAEVTSHVPQYIPKDISKLTAALNEDMLCAISPVEPNVIYVYKYYWNNNEKLQSSWSRWVFDPADQILGIDFLESTLSIVVKRSDGLYLEAIDISSSTEIADGEPYQVHLDRKSKVPKGVLTYAGGVTTIPVASLGYTPDVGEYLAVGAVGGGTLTGSVVDVTWNGTTATVPGDFTTCDLVVGRKYKFRYLFSTILPKSKTASGGEKADNVARLQLRSLQVNYADTGYFKALVTPKGRDTYTYTFTGKVLSASSSTIGAINLETGEFRFSVMSQNTGVDIELQSDSPLPCAFLSADWEGYYAKRSQGI